MLTLKDLQNPKKSVTRELSVEGTIVIVKAYPDKCGRCEYRKKTQGFCSLFNVPLIYEKTSTSSRGKLSIFRNSFCKASEKKVITTLEKTLNFSDFDNCGNLLSLQDWKDSVKAGAFIDYDGFGYLATDKTVSNLLIKPSESKEPLPAWATHVVWFNR